MEISTPQTQEEIRGKRNIPLRQVIIFLLLTFLLTWSIDFILYINGGLSNSLVKVVLQFQMLIPAFSAMLLGTFFYKDSPLYYQTNRTISRWFVYVYLFFTLVSGILICMSFVYPVLGTVLNYALLAFSVIGMIFFVILRRIGGRDAFANINMSGGKAKYWLIYAILIIAFMGLQSLLNWVFKLGNSTIFSQLPIQAALTGMSIPVFMVLVAFQTIVFGPFLGLLITFGEEYGWRGYLQPALCGLGRRLGVLLVGIIWGIWHWPVIWMGYNYPNHPWLGSLLMVLFCICLAFFLGYAVLKSRAVWLSAFLHALFNQSSAFFLAILYTPNDPAYSFGIGLPGLALMGVAVFFILRDPVWKSVE